MNIIYVHTHDLGRYIEPYGYPVRTPNFMRLAEGGTLFRDAFCVAPTCSPSRAALLTGRYPHETGMYGLTNQGWLLRDYKDHLAERLRQEGYRTALTGVQHVSGPTQEELARLPYDEFLPPIGEPGERGPDDNTPAAIEFLRRDHHAPFFLNVGYSLTHHSNWDRSFVLSRPSMGPIDTRYVRPLPHLPDTPATRWEAAMQYRATEYLDERIGLLMDALDSSRYADNTVIFFTTDHGPGLPGVKTHLNDRGLGVPLIFRGPGFPGGAVRDGLVSHLDVVPTVCELTGVPVPQGLRGSSLMPLAHDPSVRIHEELFSEQGYHGAYLPLRSVRTERYRYTRRLGSDRPTLDFNADRGEAYDLLRQSDPQLVQMAREQLYDLRWDPQEACSIVDAPLGDEPLRELRETLDQHLARTNDPALHDEIPEPPDAPPWAFEGKDAKRERVETWRRKRKNLQQEDSAVDARKLPPGFADTGIDS